MRPRLERIQYPAVRELSMATPTTETPAPNCWSIDHDERAWVAQGKAFSMYRTERPYLEARKPASATDFYNVDQTSKMSIAHRVDRSPYRYVGMRSQSAGRDGGGAYLGVLISTPDGVGPGSYRKTGSFVPNAGGRGTYHEVYMPRSEPGSSAFASGAVRGFGGPMRSTPSEPGYSTLATDRATWRKHANSQGKGYSFEKTRRFARPPGPGSNRPAEKETPGPGSYARLHSWPAKGFRGGARGFNLNTSVG